MDEWFVQYSGICHVWWVMHIPQWARDLAGDLGYWRTEDGDEYAASEMATIEAEFKSQREALDYIESVQS